MTTFSSAAAYLGTKCSIKEKIAAIDAIIDTLLLTAATMAQDDNIQEYWLNDGQVQIKAIYNGSKAVGEAIMKFERLKMMYANRLTGRVFRLMDSKNFRSGC